MSNSPRVPPALLEALRHAARGGPEAPQALRRLALLTEESDPAEARAALAALTRLQPLDPAPRLALARLHAENGALAEARAEAETVLREAVDEAARARAAFIIGEIARVTGDTAARAAYAETLRIEEALLRANPGDPSATRWYARARGRIAELDAADGDFPRALAGAEGAAAMLHASAAHVSESPELAADIADAEMRLAALELDKGEPASARRRLTHAIGRYEALALIEQDEPHWRAVLSDAWALAAEADLMRGAHADARAGMEKSLQARVRLAALHPHEELALVGTWRVSAALLAAIEDHDAAAEALAQAAALARRLHRGSAAVARLYVHTLLDQADHALRRGALETARTAAEEARIEAERQARAPSASREWLGELGACWDRLGETARAARAAAHAFDAFSRAVEFRRLAQEGSALDSRTKRALAAALVKLGEAALEAQSPQSARTALAESIDIRLQLAETTPGDLVAAQALATALERYGLAALACGDKHAARGAWEDELSLVDRIFHDHESIAAIRFRAIVLSHIAELGDNAARAQALAGFDTLAKAGVLTEREAAMRKKLWNA
ncbi:MAG: hypothetical protein JNK94_06280 [Hyphomonadaceae bacterium]|nr:hypothetical protein [Hyphomonadaceae bacterium]MBX3511478.1 hypothetical protein [Hyphomonadaceae bacterium]